MFRGRLPKISTSFLAQLAFVKWAPTTDTDEESLPWLLLSDGIRLVVVNPEAMLEQARDLGNNKSTYVAADYQLGDQHGKLAYAEFVLGSSHVLALFEHSGTASILSTQRSQRDDIPSVKFNDVQGLATSDNCHSIALVLRSTGQDRLMILGASEGIIRPQSTFNLPTADVQGVLWSPNQDPVVAAWDSASHGMRLHFFSAMGHVLKQLDLASFGVSSGLEGLGATNVRWAKQADATVLAVADSNKQVLVRHQQSRSMTVIQLGIFRHPNTIDGTKSIVWQQTEEDDFALQKRAFDAVTEPGAGTDVSILELNADQSFVASVMADNPKTVWLWQPEHPEPHTIIVCRDSIRQLSWHPELPNVLSILPAIKTSRIFAWYSETRSPVTCDIAMPNTTSSRYEATWYEKAIDGRHLFILTSTKGISTGFLRERKGIIDFEPLPEADLGLGEDGDTTEIQTPSKPSKRRQQLHSEDGEW